MKASAPEILDCFLDFPFRVRDRLIDPVLGTLKWQGGEARLRRKELEVLALLASADGAVVSRQAFIDQIWDGNNLVGEHAVTVTVSSLRQALGDSQNDNPLIRTIPRRGYQLSDPAERVTIASTSSNPSVESDRLPALTPGLAIPGCSGWKLSRRLDQISDETANADETWLAEPSQFNAEGEVKPRVFRFCRSEAQLKRLKREITLLRYVGQSLAERADFVVLRDWQLDEPPYFLARDYATAGSLQAWISSGAMPKDAHTRLRLMLCLADAMAALHAIGIVHQQFNARNVLVDAGPQYQDGVQLKVSAFGFGQLMDQSKLQMLKITAAGLSQDASAISYASSDDVHALGSVLLQLATGDLQAQAAAAQTLEAPLGSLISSCFGPSPMRPSAADLAQALRALLKAGDEQPLALSPSDAGPPKDATLPWRTPVPPQELNSIGHYRLLDRLGEGGMGVVYLAEQRDPYRKVALKVIRSGLDGSQILSRFEAERQALALMNHPNVAMVLDSGLALDGRPYFAMEYIAGDDIARYCNAHRLNPKARIELFLQVCDGVLHAHQKGVLHRDLKPSNLLVSQTAENRKIVKVIDFGLAKSMHGKLAAHTLHTSFGAFLGTPVYSSPEHVSGAVSGVDTRSDIYSLGVVLYELLAGRTPIDNESLADLALERIREIVCKSKLPSMIEQIHNAPLDQRAEIAEARSLKPEDLPKILEGDLSWVVGKCLERDPDDRYPSVLELKKDLERWLQLRPVEARPTSSWYRFRKLVRRNRGAASLVAVTVASLLAAGVAVLIGYRETGIALQQAKRAGEAAAKAAEFQVNQMKAIDPETFGVGIRNGLLKSVELRFKKGVGEQAVGTEATSNQAAGEASGTLQLRELIDGINFTELVTAQLDQQFFQPSLSVIAEKYDGYPELQATLWQSNAETMLALGLLDRAVGPQELATERRTELFGEQALPTLESKVTLAKVLRGQEKSAEALQLLEAVVELRKQDQLDNKVAFEALGNRAAIYNMQGKPALAAQDFDEIRQRARKTFGANDLTTLNADLSYASLREDDSMVLESLKKLESVAGVNHPDTLNAYRNVAVVRSRQKRFAESAEMFKNILQRYSERFGESHPKVLAAKVNLASALAKIQAFSTVKPLFQEAIKGMEDAHGKRSSGLIVARGNFGRELFESGSLVEAEAELRTAMRFASELFGPDSPAESTYRTLLAGVLRDKGDYASARTLLNERIAWLQKVGQLNTTNPQFEMGRVYAAAEDWTRACETFEQVQQQLNGGTRSDESIVLKLRSELAWCAFTRGDEETALQQIEQALVIQPQSTVRKAVVPIANSWVWAIRDVSLAHSGEV
jgi:serine/threonine protein kinase/DNA-binding winged helix-turn-helix (wHTH) protein/tetratricopeptide (TPR) repeat protein